MPRCVLSDQASFKEDLSASTIKGKEEDSPPRVFVCIPFVLEYSFPKTTASCIHSLILLLNVDEQNGAICCEGG